MTLVTMCLQYGSLGVWYGNGGLDATATAVLLVNIEEVIQVK